MTLAVITVVVLLVWVLAGRLVCEVAGYGRPRSLRGWLHPAAHRGNGSGGERRGGDDEGGSDGE